MKRNMFSVMCIGLMFGFGLERLGFADWGEVHRMFTFDSLRLFLAFAGGVALSALAWLIFKRLPARPAQPIHRGVLLGGLLFGTGWALTGACPSIAGVQLASGHLPALVTIAGILLGTWGYERVNARFLHWDAPTCGD